MALVFKDIRNKLSSPWLVALIPFILTIIFTSGYFKPYNLKLISTKTTEKNLIVYNDLDNNGNSEYIYFYTYLNSQILIHDINQKLEQVYNLPGKWFDGREQIPSYFIGDANKDSLNEIYAFSINDNDSLFVSIIQHYPDNKLISSKFITTLAKSGDRYDYILTVLGLEDNNGDGFRELLFVINAGFPLQPRAIFAWDMKNDSIYRSPVMGCAIKSRPENIHFQDINGDSIKEIFLRTVAPGNYSDSVQVPYSDQKSWIMVFTKNLDFLFEPICFGNDKIDFSTFPISINDSLFVGVAMYKDWKGDEIPFFRLYNPAGKKIDESDLEIFRTTKWNQLIKKNNRFYMTNVQNGSFCISLLKNNLKQIEKSVVIPTDNYYYFFNDIDQDGENEIIVYTILDEKLHIIRKNLENEITTSVPLKNFSAVQGISVAVKNYKPVYFIFTINGLANYMSYSVNKWYYMNFVLALAYYLLLVAGFTFLKKSWLRNLIKKQNAEKEMQNLQMQTVMNQLNPHFTFNAINTVGSAILNNEPQKAYDSLTRVSRLFRKVVDHAFQPHKTLGEEIEFVRDYLEVEKTRFGEKLSYEMKIEKGIDLNIKIPKMLIQIFAENSIKHGLFNKSENGMISIEIASFKNTVKISVEDNGIGRSAAAKKNEGRKGKGMIILKNYLELFRQQYQREITFEHFDVIHEGKVCGTRVEISIF